MKRRANTPRLPRTPAGRQLRRRLAAVAGVCLIGPLLVFLGVLSARQLEAQRSLGLVQAADAAEARAARLLPAVSEAANAELLAHSAAPLGSAALLIADRDGKLLEPRLPAFAVQRPLLSDRLRDALEAGKELEYRVHDAPAALHHYRSLVATAVLAERPPVLLELLGSYARAEDWVAASATATELLHGHARGWWALRRTEYLHAHLVRIDAAKKLKRTLPDLQPVLRELVATEAVEDGAFAGHGFYLERLRAAGATLSPEWSALIDALRATGEPLVSPNEGLHWVPELGHCVAATPLEDGGYNVGRVDLLQILAAELAPAGKAGQTAIVRDPQGNAVWWSESYAGTPPSGSQADLPPQSRILVWRQAPLRGWSLELSAVNDAAAEDGYRHQRMVLIALVLLAALVLVLATWVLLSHAARAVDLARARTDFVAGVTHDLKTPLALIRLYGETLGLHPDQDPAKRTAFAGIVVREADRLHDLVENVLQLSRGETHTPRLDGSDLAQTVAEAVGEVVLPPKPSYDVQQELASDLPEVTHAPTAVRQILRNLLANAIKFSPAGGCITVSLEREGEHAVLAVTDQGVGIAEADLETVFEAFVRLDAKGAPTPGSGLGLVIVRRLAELHRGSARAVTREHGARIEVRLPLAQQG